MVDVVRFAIRMLSVAIVVAIYITVWVFVVVNWDECVRTAYARPCWQKTVGTFIGFWVTIHILGVVLLIMWAWDPSFFAP